jgi:predicted TIM-barrel fold metal-dependent hydrolase
VPLTSPETRAAVEAFAPHELPVLFHCGISSDYPGSERSRHEPRYGAIHDAVRLVRDFPGVRFIAGHAGIFEVKRVMQPLGGLSNVWVDTSFQSVARVRQPMGVFGPERVLFASDWPYGNRPPALEIVRRVCAGDRGLERRILFENAAELLRIASVA